MLLLLLCDRLRPAAAQQPEGWLDLTTWTVQTDGTVQPLAGVTVLLADSTGAQVAVATSDESGAVRIEAAPGAYSLTLYRDGYAGLGAMACDGTSWDASHNVRWGDFSAEQELGLQITLGRGLCRRYAFASEPPPAPPLEPAPAAAPANPAGVVYLTFDDGYVALCQTVDLVISLGVHATFFLTGQAMLIYPDCVRRLVAAGNELGNHTFAHENLTRLSGAQIVATLQRTEDAALSVAGVSTRPLCRPPYGAINAFVRAVAADWGCRMVLWDRDTRDWAGTPAASITVTALSVSCRGEVILMHTQAFRQDQFALPTIVQALRDRGCEPGVL